MSGPWGLNLTTLALYSHAMTTMQTAKMTPIKLTNTRNGWAIALLRGTSYSDGTPYYEVVRVAPDNKYLVLHREGDLQKARDLANREWAADRAA